MVGGRYRLERVVGTGGMALVALARDEELDRPVAVKLVAEHLAVDERFRERFSREARMAARLIHPNIVQVYDVGEERGRPYIVMEYVDGVTLGSLVDEGGPLPAGEVVDIAIQICAGLEHAHAAGVVHRDVKPGNLLRRPDGAVKVADFGIARELDSTRFTQPGVVMGTVGYLAPEQATGDRPATAASDLYSLGAVLYLLLTGRPPFRARSAVEALVMQREQAVTPPGQVVPGIPPDLDAVVVRCLDPEPDGRPTSAADLARELAAASPQPTTEPIPEDLGVRATEVTGDGDGSTRPLTVPPEVQTRPRRAGRAWLALLAALLVVGFVIGWVLTAGSDGGGAPSGGDVSPQERTIRDARDLAEWIRENAG
jgi:serine/threonine-protein kinase